MFFSDISFFPLESQQSVQVSLPFASYSLSFGSSNINYRLTWEFWLLEELGSLDLT